ncbi:phenylalanine--tRNA ligase subunit beta [Aquimarina brevivitae]|uniref:Phenylalanine--tRNA ligase beta subunit n=1 Tax=Aquimarina brevivitae TaxID=323412 RepID=A0A4Q7P138_9FLAO|nr:phenylalanine--tRNA ligase subunit beta [Aquimarina brevivitae]RZS93533.1 phenylalanyl-tRNA synthetase beta subunit [Aquimarina brevivitae]
MKISFNWIKQFIDIDWTAEETGELLTDLGLEVEGIEPFQSVKGGLEGVVVGHVLECTKHPNADKLKLTKVDVGQGDPVQIVCGAPNVAEGQKVPVATIGTKLYDAEGKEWIIKKGKIRGESSHGMICAEDELGLGNDHDGILVLDPSFKVGTPVAELFNIENDLVFEIGLTPNRADAMSHWGTARDLKAGLQQKGFELELKTPSVSNFYVANRTHKIDIEVVNPELAPRYCGLTISGLEVTESPDWLKNRLKAIGLTPKNIVVDVTNYVLHELGQPLHAFDTAKIEGGKIEVKTVAQGTKFTTLDEVERELHAEDLMICDAKKPLCIAGIFGGVNSGVTESTSAIFLESAYFDPVSVRKTAKRHGLNTDASFRFERGIDPNSVDYALKRAALLIQELAGGEITSELLDFYPKKMEDHQVFLSFDKVTQLIGEELYQDTIKSILSSLDIKITSVTESGLGLNIPVYRNDVVREVDVIEEILRVYGYNNIDSKDKLNASIANIDKFADHSVQNKIADQLIGQGFYEIMANSLTTATYNEVTGQLKDEHNVEMLNPLSSDLAILRRSMLFSGLEAISYNINRKRANLKLFEFGKTYHHFGEDRIENKHLAVFISGDRTEESWTRAAQRVDFFYLKATALGILERLGFSNLTTATIKNDMFAEGISLNLGKNKLVELGVIKKSVLKKFSIAQEVLYAEFDWDTVLELTKRNKAKFTEIPKYPEVRRDFALLLDDTVRFEDIYTIAKQSEKKLLKEISLFDVYQGSNLPKGKKSYAVSFILQDEQKTLTDKQIDKIMKKLQSNFESKLGAELR